MWDASLESLISNTRNHNDKMNEIIQLSPRRVDGMQREEEENNMPMEKSSDAEEVATVANSGTHSMVMIGFITNMVNGKEKKLFVLWNWWRHMPLVAVSFEYLVACQCDVYFLHTMITANSCNSTERNGALALDCAFPDHGEKRTFQDHLVR